MVFFFYREYLLLRVRQVLQGVQPPIRGVRVRPGRPSPRARVVSRRGRGQEGLLPGVRGLPSAEGAELGRPGGPRGGGCGSVGGRPWAGVAGT